jgi:hypothetical protein
MPEYAAQAVEAFAQVRERFEEILGWLAGAEAGALEHGELEDQLGERGRELVRLMFQGQLDLRALREQRRQDVAGPEGAMRTRAENDHRRPLATVFGEVAVSRIAYRAPGLPNVHVTDEELNLPEEKHSHGLRRLAAIEAPRGSYEDAAAALTRTTGVRIGKRQVEDLVMRAAADVDAFYQARRPAPAPEDQVLMLQADGKGIVMREEGLRPATAKAAAAAKRKVAARLSPGEKNGRKRMAEIAAVSDVIPAARTPADIIAPPGAARADPPKTQGKWLTASVTDDIPAVIAAAFDEMQRRDPGHERTWIALVDGNNTQIDAIEAEAQARGITVPVLIDFVHVIEYVWKAAWTFFEPGDPDAADWVAGRATAILEGKAAQVAAGIRRRATTYGYSQHERKGAGTCAAYLDAKAPYLDYPAALASGWPIATGIIEGACRHIIKDRFDITGARWGLGGAEAVLKLRALHANGDFEQYWPWHLHRERQRVYGLAA